MDELGTKHWMAAWASPSGNGVVTYWRKEQHTVLVTSALWREVQEFLVQNVQRKARLQALTPLSEEVSGMFLK